MVDQIDQMTDSVDQITDSIDKVADYVDQLTDSEYVENVTDSIDNITDNIDNVTDSIDRIVEENNNITVSDNNITSNVTETTNNNATVKNNDSNLIFIESSDSYYLKLPKDIITESDYERCMPLDGIPEKTWDKSARCEIITGYWISRDKIEKYCQEARTTGDLKVLRLWDYRQRANYIETKYLKNESVPVLDKVTTGREYWTETISWYTLIPKVLSVNLEVVRMPQNLISWEISSGIKWLMSR